MQVFGPDFQMQPGQDIQEIGIIGKEVTEIMDCDGQSISKVWYVNKPLKLWIVMDYSKILIGDRCKALLITKFEGDVFWFAGYSKEYAY